MGETLKRYTALVAAVALLMAPGHILPHVFPEFFHEQPLRTLAVCLASAVFTMPVLMKAHRYFHGNTSKRT